MNKSCIIAQSGGPTAVINCTLLGIVEEAKKMGFEHIYGALNGIEGVLNHRIVELTNQTHDQLQLLMSTPGAALGSGRHQLKNAEQDPETYQHIQKVFESLGIDCFFYIGGNDSMDTCNKVANYFAKTNFNCNVIGVPKTIDNDLQGTDHTPGFGSAAKFVSTTISEIYVDTNSYKKGRVTIVEVMGRNAGWLTAACKLADLSNTPVDLIYLPERPFDLNSFLQDVQAIYNKKQKVLVAVSEGIRDANGQYILKTVAQNKNDSFGHTQLGGVAQTLCDIISEQLSLPVRHIELNLLQRCSAHISSAADAQEAYNCGVFALQMATQGHTCKMVSMFRDSQYHISLQLKDIDNIANAVQIVPDKYINEQGNGITDDFVTYALPLVQGEVPQHYKNGMPQYYQLDLPLVEIKL